jgi:hypothetical protein
LLLPDVGPWRGQVSVRRLGCHGTATSRGGGGGARNTVTCVCVRACACACACLCVLGPPPSSPADQGPPRGTCARVRHLPRTAGGVWCPARLRGHGGCTPLPLPLQVGLQHAGTCTPDTTRAPPSLPPSLPPPLPHCRVQRVLACALAKADWLPKGLALPRVGLVTALRAWVEANPPPCVAAPAGDVDTAEALLPLARAWLSLILRGKDAPSESLVEGYADAAAERLVADEDDDVLCALLSALEVGFQVQQPIAAPCPPPPLRSSDWLLGEGPPQSHSFALASSCVSASCVSVLCLCPRPLCGRGSWVAARGPGRCAASASGSAVREAGAASVTCVVCGG